MIQVRNFQLIRIGRAKRLTKGDLGPALEIGGGLQLRG